MTKIEFIDNFREELGISKKDLNNETRLDSLDEWDSWNKLTLMTWVDETFEVNLTAKDLETNETIGDLLKTIGENKFDN